MLYLIGVGLHSIEDITLKGLIIAKKCDFVYIESYTSILAHGINVVEDLIGKEIKPADRECVEQTNVIINAAKKNDVAFLVVGDPLTATTHVDLLLRCIEAQVPIKVIHNASILNAAGCSGLQLYEFGETTSIPFWDELGKPESFYDKIEHNFIRGLHTLCLLDIRVKEKSVENILRQRDIFEPSRYMSCQQAAYQILCIVTRRGKAQHEIPEPDAFLPMTHMHSVPVLSPNTLAIGLARIGSEDRVVAVATLADMAYGFVNPDNSIGTAEETVSPPISDLLNGPLHSLVIPGRLQPLEIEWLTARERYPDQSWQITSPQTGVKADSLPYIFVRMQQSSLATTITSDMSVDQREHRKSLVDVMFNTHCQHAVHIVAGDME